MKELTSNAPYLPTAMLDEEATPASVVRVVGEINVTAGELRNKVYWLKKNDNWKLAYPYQSWSAFITTEIRQPRGTVEHWVEQEEVAQGLSQKTREGLAGSQLKALSAAPPEQREAILKEARSVAPLNKMTGRPQLSANVIEEVIQKHNPVVADTTEDIETGQYRESLQKMAQYTSPPDGWTNTSQSTDELSNLDNMDDGEYHHSLEDSHNGRTIKQGVLVPNLRKKKLYVSDVDDEVELEIDSSYYPALAEFLFTVATPKQRESYLRRLQG
jgi:hypothetical protein